MPLFMHVCHHHFFSQEINGTAASAHCRIFHWRWLALEKMLCAVSIPPTRGNGLLKLPIPMRGRHNTSAKRRLEAGDNRTIQQAKHQGRSKAEKKIFASRPSHNMPIISMQCLVPVHAEETLEQQGIRPRVNVIRVTARFVGAPQVVQ